MTALDAIQNFMFLSWSEEERKKVINQLIEDQSDWIREVKEKFAENLTSQQRESEAMYFTKFMYKYFSEYHDKELSIQYFLEIINEVRNLDEEQAKKAAEDSYKWCLASAYNDSGSGEVIRVRHYMREDDDIDDAKEKAHNAFGKDPYFKKVVRCALGYDEAKFNQVFRRDFAGAIKNIKGSLEGGCSIF